jgi:hypothetical protein
MDEGTGFCRVCRLVMGKPAHVAFDGGQMTSDTGILLLAVVDRRGRHKRLPATLAQGRERQS